MFHRWEQDFVAPVLTRTTVQGVGKSADPIREEHHEAILKEVNELAAEYTVVVFKTTGVIPYSSVFFTFDCGNWFAEVEKALRKNMNGSQ